MEARGMARSQYSHAHLSRDTGENLMNLHRTILALLMTLLSVATFARDMGPRPDAQTREEVLRLREAAWRTWFGNDQEGFKRVVPNELVAFNWDGGTWEDRDMVLQGMSEFAGTGLKLTSLEYRLLEYLMMHMGKVVSRTELVEHLYDQDFDRDSNTVEVFVGRLRKKLGVDVLHTIRGMGYCVQPPGNAD